MQIFRPLAQRPISRLWVGQVLSATGTEFYMVAVVWIASGLIGARAGYVSALQAGALLFGSLFGGMITDRWRHGSTMIGADLLRAALVLSLSLAGLLGMMSLPLLAAVAGCVALVSSTFDPALQATLPMLVPQPALRHATNALFDATRRMARILGPGLVALVNGILPTGQFFVVTAATFLLSAQAVRLAVRGQPLSRPRRDLAGIAAVIDSLIGGLRAVRGHTVLIYGLFASLVGNVTWAMGLLLGMMLHLRQGSSDPLTDYSLMMTAYGVGNLASNLLLGSIGPGRPALRLVLSKLIFGLGVFLLPLTSDRPWLMLVAALAAINGPFETLAMLHLMQNDLPPNRMAQVYRLQMCAVFSGLLLAYLAAPSLFNWFGFAPVIMGAGTATFAAGLAGLVFLLRKDARCDNQTRG